MKKLFNPDASDNNIKVFGGETTNLLNLEAIKYQWAHDIFDAIFVNNWLPHRVSMGEDKQQLKLLTSDERSAYEDILSFLIFLDSIQTNNIPNIAAKVTAPDIIYILARQDYDEALHSKSYGWILSSLFTHEEASKIVYRWRDNTLLLERNKFIANIYDEVNSKNDIVSFVKGCVANYMLEGLYFYNGFQFFHNLASRGLMTGTDTQIRYIQRDEIQHCNIFKNILLETFRENEGLKEEVSEMIYDLFRQAVEWEIKFSISVIGNKVLGQTEQSIEDYTYFLANRRLKDIKLSSIFPKRENPYKHLDQIAGVEDETSNRSNNFELTSINYKNRSVLSGFDEI